MGAKIIPAIIQNLKSTLRRKKISYRQLAPKLAMSESGLKKLFLSKDISFSRLFQICAVLGIPVSDFLREIERGDSYQHTFSAIQENYFLKNRLGFNVFWKLVYERIDQDSVRQELNLKEREFNIVLKRLEDLELIRMRAGKVKLPRVREITWSRNGVFTKKLLNEWSYKLLSEQLNESGANEGQLILRYFCFQKPIYDELVEKLKLIEKEFLQHTVRDMNLYDSKNLTRVGWLSVAARTSFVDLKKITKET